MLRESSSRTASTFRCATALDSTSVGPQEACEHEHYGERAHRAEHHPVDPGDAAELPSGEHDQRQRTQGRECDQPDGNDGRPHEVAASEQPRRVLEQEGEDGLERCSQSPPDR